MTSKFLKYMPVVAAIASLSKDRRRKVGALVLGPDLETRSTGRNGFARGVNDDVEERHATPEKFFWTAHAEENAISQAARSGISLDGCIILVTELFPCSTCARLIIQCGIKKVIAPVPQLTSKWHAESVRSAQMFKEAGVEIIYLTKEKP